MVGLVGTETHEADARSLLAVGTCEVQEVEDRQGRGGVGPYLIAQGNNNSFGLGSCSELPSPTKLSTGAECNPLSVPPNSSSSRTNTCKSPHAPHRQNE